jgi:uncharacterized protein (TIGR02270 family)
MSGANGGAIPEKAVVWDVVEEHLDEAEFLFDQFERALDSSTLTLMNVAKGLEERLLAHLDGLLVGGVPVYERLLKPSLAEPDPGQPRRITAAAMVAIEGGQFEGIWPAMGHDEAVVRDAVVRAGGLAGEARFERWVANRLAESITLVQRASLLGVIARRGLEPPAALIEWLQSDDLALVRAAAQAARHADPSRHMGVIEWRLDHDDDIVQEAALIAAWTWGSRLAPAVCERWALDPVTPRALPMALYAAMGGPAEHEHLAALLARTSHRSAALFALGFSGSVAQVQRLLDYLHAEEPRTAKLAAQAIATIVGVNLLDDAFAMPPPKEATRPAGEDAPAKDDEEDARALPPLADDDLEADLGLLPEDGLPMPNASAIRRFCEDAAARMDHGRRYLGGQEFRAEAAVDYLASAPLRRRHVIGVALAIRTQGAARVDTRGLAANQRRQLDGLRNADWSENAPSFRGY